MTINLAHPFLALVAVIFLVWLMAGLYRVTKDEDLYQ